MKASLDKNDLLLEQWKMAAELHRHMDDMAWRRFNYFIAMNAVLVSVLAEIFTRVVISAKGFFVSGFVTSLISVFGMAVSLVWSLVQWRAQRYHHYRIVQANQAEEALKICGERVLDLYRDGLNDQKLVPVPALVKRVRTLMLIVWLAVVFTVGWFVMLGVGMSLLMFSFLVCIGAHL